MVLVHGTGRLIEHSGGINQYYISSSCQNSYIIPEYNEATLLLYLFLRCDVIAIDASSTLATISAQISSHQSHLISSRTLKESFSAKCMTAIQ